MGNEKVICENDNDSPKLSTPTAQLLWDFRSEGSSPSQIIKFSVGTYLVKIIIKFSLPKFDNFGHDLK
jgi:hypothetical protein